VTCQPSAYVYYLEFYYECTSEAGRLFHANLYLSYFIYYGLVTSIMTNIGKTMLAFAILLTLTAGIAILPEYVSAQPNITMGNATGGNMSETNNSTGFIP
jgi:hypothetical protein